MPNCTGMNKPGGPVDCTLAGRVVALSVQPSRATPDRVSNVRAIAGLGLETDRHASRTSPRQVLIASRYAYQALQLPPMALRQNVLVDFEVRSLVSGDRLQIGADVELVAMFRCEPCSRLERHRVGLSRHIGNERGVMARVIHGGSMRQGDAVKVLRASGPLWSDDWRERVVQVLRLVPADRWVTFGQLAELAGVAAGYCRAFPRLLASLDSAWNLRAGPASSCHERGAPWNGDGLHDTLLFSGRSSAWM